MEQRKGEMLQASEDTIRVSTDMTEVQLALLPKIMKVTKRVIAPYVQIERRKTVDSVTAEPDTSTFKALMPPSGAFLKFLYCSIPVIKNAFDFNGSFLYKVNEDKKELVLVPRISGLFTGLESQRHEVNMPLEKGKSLAAHAAATRQCVASPDARRDRRYADGVRWAAAGAALAVPILMPSGRCYGVIELYNTDDRQIPSQAVCATACMAKFVGTALEQGSRRKSLAVTHHLQRELLVMVRRMFCDKSPFDSIICSMLAISKTCLSAMRSSFYLIEQDELLESPQIEMWDDGWRGARTMRRRVTTLVGEKSPAALVVETGEFLNVTDAYNDARFAQELDLATGVVTRCVLAGPVWSDGAVTGVLQVINKEDGQPFDLQDEDMFRVLLKYCSLIINYNNNCIRNIFGANNNAFLSDLIAEHGRVCPRDAALLTAAVCEGMVPRGFYSLEYCFTSSDNRPALVCYMLQDILGEDTIPQESLVDFVITLFRLYSDNPYHNSDYAVTFTHAVYVILKANPVHFNLVERFALMLTGLLQVARRPPYTNGCLTKMKHPAAVMYDEKPIERLNVNLGCKILEHKRLLSNLSPEMAKQILNELEFSIQATNCYSYIQIANKLEKVLELQTFNWFNQLHRYYAKNIVIASCVNVRCCKGFDDSKRMWQKYFLQCYNQGEVEREMGYRPCRHLDQQLESRQPQFLMEYTAMVVLPGLVTMQRLLRNTENWVENCRSNVEAWRKELSLRDQRMWCQEESIPKKGGIVAVKISNVMSSYNSQFSIGNQLKMPTG